LNHCSRSDQHDRTPKENLMRFRLTHCLSVSAKGCARVVRSCNEDFRPRTAFAARIQPFECVLLVPAHPSATRDELPRGNLPASSGLLTLKEKLQRKLKVAGCACTVKLPVPRTPYGRIRCSKRRNIKGIIKLRAKLKPKTLGKLEVLQQGQIPAV
jgi:hypothetical protein